MPRNFGRFKTSEDGLFESSSDGDWFCRLQMRGCELILSNKGREDDHTQRLRIFSKVLGAQGVFQLMIVDWFILNTPTIRLVQISTCCYGLELDSGPTVLFFDTFPSWQRRRKVGKHPHQRFNGTGLFYTDWCNKNSFTVKFWILDFGGGCKHHRQNKFSVHSPPSSTGRARATFSHAQCKTNAPFFCFVDFRERFISSQSDALTIHLFLWWMRQKFCVTLLTTSKPNQAPFLAFPALK